MPHRTDNTSASFRLKASARVRAPQCVAVVYTQISSGSVASASTGALLFNIQGFVPPMSVNQEEVSRTISRLFLAKDSG